MAHDDDTETASRRMRLLVAFVWLAILGGIIGIGWSLGERVEDERIDGPAAPTSPRLLDSFEPAAPTVLGGSVPTGLRWLSLGAGFDVADGFARVGAEPAGEPAIALVDTQWTSLVVGVTVEEAATNTGVVFRFEDLSNFWSVVAVPEFATWNVILTRDGEVAGSWPIGFAATEPGTELEIGLNRAQIRVFVNGELKLNLADPSFGLATPAGIISTSGSGGSFSEFYAVADQASPTG